ncbi:RNA-binding S4 domain-containing protein [Acidocella sp.]|uniref:RNA-binding S4 domain-containing protein n=1 Tax=Acidocella sp. TaxID=50710 RepID=UPI002637EF31|nr:RNA-binding S4 domain-containing protein [Acidocella sp.]
MAAEELRLDKFLVFARFCKTREAAALLVEKGAVRINRQVTEKPHAKVRPGDVLTLALPHGVKVIEVLGLPARRGPAPQAHSCYQDIS